MTVETSPLYPSDLNASYPGAGDPIPEGDDHIRNLKTVLKTTFPNVSGAVNPSHTELNYVVGVTSAIQAQINSKGAIASQSWTGTHDFTGSTITVPTATAGDNTTKAANMLAMNVAIAAAAMSASTPTVIGDLGKVWTSTGSIGQWTATLKASVMRWADGTDATKLLAYDLSGVTTGTTRTITVPNKNGTMAFIADTGLTPLASLTPTAVAALDFLTTFTSTYDNYLILIEGIKPSADDSLVMRFANAGVVDAGSHYFSPILNAVADTTAATSTDLLPALAAGIGMSLEARILNTNDATNMKSLNGMGTYQSAATPGYAAASFNSVYSPASAISGFRLYWSGGANFAAVGKIRVYGYSNA